METSQAAPDHVAAEVRRIAAVLGCRAVHVRSSRQYAVPFLYGLRRPLLVLPERMCQPAYRAQLPGILAHKLAHVRSGDFGWNALLQGVSLWLWFHPLAWRMGSAHRAACDAVCDAISAAYLGDVETYCRTLARVALEGAASFPAAGLAMDRTCDVRRRIALLQQRVFAASLGRRAVVGAALVGLLSLAVLAGVRLGLAVGPDGPGRVADAEGRGIVNATVKRIDSPWSARTNAEGYFPLPGLKSGESAHFSVSAKGFLPLECADLHYDMNGGYQLLGGWPIQLARPVTLSGRVLGPDGKPLAKAPVSIDTWVQLPQHHCSTAAYQRTITDAQGRFTMPHIPPGSHVLYYPAETSLPIPAKGVYGALVVEPTDGQQLSGLVLDLSESTASVEGRVFGPDGKPMAGASVFLCRYRQWQGNAGGGGPQLPPATTDARGHYKLTGIGPGQWQIHPFHPRFQRPSPCRVVSVKRGKTAQQDLHVTERYQEGENSVSPAIVEAERTDDMSKIPASLWSLGGLPPVKHDPANFGELVFLSLSPGQIADSRTKVKSLGLAAAATPEEIAKAAHTGELYFEPPDHLVTVNGTIVAPFLSPPERRAGSSFDDWIRQMTRAELVEQVEASRRKNPDADGRRVTVRKGENYLVVRNDGQGWLMHIDRVNGESVGLTFLYFGHLRLKPRTAAETTSTTSSAKAAALMQAVYQSRTWIESARSFHIRSEYKHTYTEEGSRNEEKEAKRRPFGLANNRNLTKPFCTKDEWAWDESHVLCRTQSRDRGETTFNCQQTTTWDGSLAVECGESPDHKHYVLGNKADRFLDHRVDGMLQLPWGPGDGYHFWWSPADVAKHRANRGIAPEDFELAGQEEVGGRRCYVVQSRAGHYRMHIGVADGRLYRRTWLIARDGTPGYDELALCRKIAGPWIKSFRQWCGWLESRKPDERGRAFRELQIAEFEFARPAFYQTFADYREVAPGCWLAFRQTVDSYGWDAGKPFLDHQTEQVVTEVTVNRPLPKELFHVELVDGVRVSTDWRYDPPIRYAYRKSQTEAERVALCAAERAKLAKSQKMLKKFDAVVEGRMGQTPPPLPASGWLNSKPLTWEDLRGKVVVLHFWEVGCGPCLNELPLVAAWHENAAQNGTMVIGIHPPTKDLTAVRKVLAKFDAKYPVLIDSPAAKKGGLGLLHDWFGNSYWPHTVLIGKDGVVAGHGQLWMGDVGKQAARLSTAEPQTPTPDGKSAASPIAEPQEEFVLHGVSRQNSLSLAVPDPRFAPWAFYIEPLGTKRPSESEKKQDATAHEGEHIYPRDVSEEITLVLPAPQIIEGQVVYADNHQPAVNAHQPEANARLTVYSWNGSRGRLGSSTGIAGKADAEGRFRLNPFPSKFFEIAAYPAVGQPYLILQKSLDWPDGTASQKVEFALPRGILVRGKVTEEPSGKPVLLASVQYQPCQQNPHLPRGVLTGWQGIVLSIMRGAFQIAVPPGRGTLLIHGPTQDYIAQAIGSEELSSGEPQPGGIRNYVHAAVHLDLAPNAPAKEVTVVLRKGVTVSGRLLDPQGKPAPEVLMLSRLVWPSTPWWRASPLTVQGGRFELAGCDPEKSTLVYFLDPTHQWGATVELGGRSAAEPAVVRLQPCGSASVRFVDPQGKPIAGLDPMLEIVMTPGPGKHYHGLIRRTEKGQWLADEDSIANFDRHHYWFPGPVTDGDGRVTLPCLVPGATYRLYNNGGHMVHDVAKDFSVRPGERLQLPDIVMERPAQK